MIFLVNKGKKEFNGKRLTDVWYFDRVSSKNQLHQNEKPLKLLELAIKKHSDKNDMVFDGFMGSGSSIVAAYNLERKYFGIEIEDKYCNIAKKRIQKLKEVKDIENKFNKFFD